MYSHFLFLVLFSFLSVSLASVRLGNKQVCDCDEGEYFVHEKCFGSLKNAVKEGEKYNEPVYLGSKVYVKSQVTVMKNLELIGVNCGSEKATMIVSMNKSIGSAFYLKGVLNNKDQKISLINVDFMRDKKSGSASLLRTKEINDGLTAYSIGLGGVNLLIVKCRFEHFKTRALGGGAIFIQRAIRVRVKDSRFERNVVDTDGERYGGGGGGLSIHESGPKTSIKITNTIFNRNHHLFEHGLGGGLFLGIVGGEVFLQGNTYRNNTASSGGGLHIGRAANTSMGIYMDDDFIDNTAVEYGWRSRGGAMKLGFVHAVVEIKGRFIRNSAPGGRAAVVANNRVLADGVIILNASFVDNSNARGATIFDTLYRFSFSTAVVVADDCVFKNNFNSNNTNITAPLIALRTVINAPPRNTSSDSAYSIVGKQKVSRSLSVKTWNEFKSKPLEERGNYAIIRVNQTLAFATTTRIPPAFYIFPSVFNIRRDDITPRGEKPRPSPPVPEMKNVTNS